MKFLTPLLLLLFLTTAYRGSAQNGGLFSMRLFEPQEIKFWSAEESLAVNAEVIQVKLSETKIPIDLNSEYNYNDELGFFCKFEDHISRRSFFRIDLGLSKH